MARKTDALVLVEQNYDQASEAIKLIVTGISALCRMISETKNVSSA